MLDHLKTLYSDVTFDGRNKWSKPLWSFTHAACGTHQQWTQGNLAKSFKLRPGVVPCSRCGAKSRWANGMKAWIEKYGRDYDASEWKQYQRKVRQLSDRVYRKNKAIINPLNLPRGMRTYHLDHKLSIFEGFKQGLEPEVVARVENLQMLPATENISKGHRLM